MARQILAVSLALLLALVACAQQDSDRVLLRYQWNAGEETVWQVNSETTGTVIVRDRTRDPVQEQAQDIWALATMPLTLTVEAVDDGGNATISYRLGVMEVDVAAQGEQQYVRIDPEPRTMTVNGQEQPLPEQMMAAILQPITMTMSPRGELLRVQLPEGAPMGVWAGLDIARWMRMGQQCQATFPEQPVPVGYSWASSVPPPFETTAPGDDEAERDAAAGDAENGDNSLEGPAATMVFTLAGWETMEDVRCARVEMVGAMDLGRMAMPPGMTGSGMMPASLEGAMGPMHASLSGSFLFDPTAGKLVSTRMHMLMDIDQHISGTVETPEGERNIDTEIVIRDLLIETTMEPQ